MEEANFLLNQSQRVYLEALILNTSLVYYEQSIDELTIAMQDYENELQIAQSRNVFQEMTSLAQSLANYSLENDQLSVILRDQSEYKNLVLRNLSVNHKTVMAILTATMNSKR